jgi:hypothetical protein
VIVLLIAAFVLVLPNVAFAAASVSVTIESPADGTTITLGAGETTANVPVSGKASVAGDSTGKNITLVYTVDRSSSMGTNAGVECRPPAGNDSRFLCMKEAVKDANAVAAGPSSIALAGLAAFDANAAVQDVDRTAAGVQVLVPPGFDSADPGTTPDVVDASEALTLGAGTNYSAGLTATISILNNAANTQPHNLVIFLSDGRNNSGSAVTSVTIPANTLIKTFALGNEVSCMDRSIASGGKGSLQDVADMSTEGPGAGNTSGVCKVVKDMSKLGEEITAAIVTSLNTLTWNDNGGAKTFLSNAQIDPDLPQPAPKTVSWNFTANGLAIGTHKICVEAKGLSGATGLSAEDCVTITIAPPPDPCTDDYGDPGLLTTDTLGQTLWDGGLQIPPLTEDPNRNGIISGPVGTLFEGTPLEVVGDEVACLVDLLLDETVIPIDL